MKGLRYTLLILLSTLITTACLPSAEKGSSNTNSTNNAGSGGSNSGESPTNGETDETEASHDHLTLYINKAVDIDGWDKFESRSAEPAEVIVEFDEERMISTITLLSGEGRLVRVLE